MAITAASTSAAMPQGWKLFFMDRRMTSSRTDSSVSSGTGSGRSLTKICIWPQSAAFSQPAAAHSSARDACCSDGSGSNWEASGR